MNDKKLNWTYGNDYFSQTSESIDEIFDQTEEVIEQKEESGKQRGITTSLSYNLLGDEADYYETLHNNLILPFRDKNWIPKTISLTSSKDGEGVSSISSKLAISLANHIEGHVLLVDSNFENPFLHKIFRTPLSPGFGEVLTGEMDLPQAIYQSIVPNLHLLPTGDLGYNPTPKYDSSKFGDLLKKMESKYTFTLFDCPSIERDPNAAARLSSMIDGLILVVEAQETKWEILERIKIRLENANANILGVVLNKRKFYVPGWLYRRM